MHSNADSFADWLGGVLDDFDFNSPGVHLSLRDDASSSVAEGIQERSKERQCGAKDVWPENEYSYRKDKAEKYGTELTNYRTSQMLSTESLLANVGTTDNGRTAVMQYGTGTAPKTSMTGYIEDADKLVTDTEKAAFAHELGRPFFQVDQEIGTTRVLPLVSEALQKYLDKKMS